MTEKSDYYSYSTYEETINYLKAKLPPQFQNIQIGIVCGSGLGGLENTLIGDKVEFLYKVTYFIMKHIHLTQFE